MSIWKNLLDFGIVEKGLELVDDAFLTDSERGKLKIVLMRLYEPYKLIQRYLALIVTLAFVGLHVIYSLCDIIVVVRGGEAIFAELSQRNIDTLGAGWEWIMIWYFTGGMVEGGAKAFTRLRDKK
jgi:hypothetical protein